MVARSLLAAGLLAATASATFNAQSNNNVVTYWGQGNAQDRLSVTCENPNVDIVNIGFVNYFPDQAGADGGGVLP